MIEVYGWNQETQAWELTDVWRTIEELPDGARNLMLVKLAEIETAAAIERARS